ncbi:hypothetical protein ACIBLA_17305 [Streptomyces sp. NPDC050433]|uniref:hypothetical protein n=1 Tax=unclassified Streptomyces TaxID=2593676 RepID=UPI00343036B5
MPTPAVLLVCAGLLGPGTPGIAMALVKAEKKTGTPADILFKSIGIVVLGFLPKHKHHHRGDSLDGHDNPND